MRTFVWGHLPGDANRGAFAGRGRLPEGTFPGRGRLPGGDVCREGTFAGTGRPKTDFE